MGKHAQLPTSVFSRAIRETTWISLLQEAGASRKSPNGSLWTLLNQRFSRPISATLLAVILSWNYKGEDPRPKPLLTYLILTTMAETKTRNTYRTGLTIYTKHFLVGSSQVKCEERVKRWHHGNERSSKHDVPGLSFSAMDGMRRPNE